MVLMVLAVPGSAMDALEEFVCAVVVYSLMTWT